MSWIGGAAPLPLASFLGQRFLPPYGGTDDVVPPLLRPPASGLRPVIMDEPKARP